MSKEYKTSKAVALCRVSVAEQTTNGLSIKAQQRNIAKFAKRQNITVVKWWNITSYGEPYLEDIFEYCLEHEDIKFLLVSSFDRICRCADHYNQSIATFKEIGVEVLTDIQVETLSQTIQRDIASYQSKMLSERVKRGMQRKAEQGLSLSKPPLGYISTTVSGLFKQDKLGFQIKTILHAIATESVSFKKGYEQLSKAIEQRTGKPLRKDQFSRLLRNVYYTGRVQYGSQQYPGKHQPLLSEDQHKKVKQLFEANALGHKRVKSI